jgi:hypothetical protein
MVDKYTCNNCDTTFCSKKNHEIHTTNCYKKPDNVINQAVFNLSINIDGKESADENGNINISKTIDIPDSCNGIDCNCAMSSMYLDLVMKNLDDTEALALLFWLFVNSKDKTIEGSKIFFKDGKWNSSVTITDETIDRMSLIIIKAFAKNKKVIEESTLNADITKICYLITTFVKSSELYVEDKQAYYNTFFELINRAKFMISELLRI